MKRSDRKLGMHRDITRRDFIHDVGLASLGLSLPASAWAAADGAELNDAYYPPTLNGLRGAHPGSFEVAHALAREGKLFDQPRMLDEQYDLIVLGGGLSGLAAVYFHQKLHGPDARILVLDNHDDFGGHAKRNEFHHDGEMRLAWGGTVNIEYEHYSPIARGLLDDLGIDIPRLLEDYDFGWLHNSTGLKPATWFDRQTYGKDVLLPGLLPDELSPRELAARVDEFPISESARSALRHFLLSEQDVLAGMTEKEKLAYLRGTSYRKFMREHFDMPDEVVQVFSGLSMGYWGVRAEDLSVMECLESDLPGAHVLGDFWQSQNELTAQYTPSAMFPDGNASIARLLVRRLIPGAFPGMPADADPFSIVTAALEYDALDQVSSPVRLRLSATGVHAENNAQEPGVSVSYVKAGEVLAVRAKSCVLACNNRIIPSLCPQLPLEQKMALKQSIRRPLLVMNVLLRNGHALKKSGVSGGYLPGRICQTMALVTGVNVKDYHPQWRPEDPCVLQFYGTVGAPEADGLSITQQSQAARAHLLGMRFEDFEREVRTVLSGIWGSSGLDPAQDILAITVNRWPHGYARDHIDLEDKAWNTEPLPNVVGRQSFGNIAIANSDAGADAFTHTAIDQAWRAVNDLVAKND